MNFGRTEVAGKTVYDHQEQLPAGFLASCRQMPYPQTLLMCPPDNFDVVDVKNPHMEGNIGGIDTAAANKQWNDLLDTFLNCGVEVELIEPETGCEDMVFCANQTLVGLNVRGEKVCILSRMKHESRQREVAAFGNWFGQHGYRVESDLPEEKTFEGSGDAIWHPGRGLIWGGYGFRTDSQIYQQIGETFGVPVIRLALKSERFYHLDTCFAAIDERTVLIHPNSFTADGLSIIRTVFENVIECDDAEAQEGMACNATAIGGRHVVIQRGNSKVVSSLNNLGYLVHEVATSEFLKSGGSVFCMKMYVF